MTNLRDLGTILGIWAHPDDEVVLSGGIMAAAVQNGQRVVVVTATAGDKGASEKWPAEGLGEIRAAELTKSLQILGVSELIWLGCPDGSCGQLSGTEVINEIQAIIGQIQPDTILTFGPDGFTGHPDHRAVSRWATAAWQQSSPQTRLLYATTTPQWAIKFNPQTCPQAFFATDAPGVTNESDLAVNFDLSPKLWDLKLRAIKAHASQMDNLLEGFGDDFMQPENQSECFCLAG